MIEGQRVLFKLDHEITLREGVVLDIYDNEMARILYRYGSYKYKECMFIASMQPLVKDGKPVIANKNIFGQYKVYRRNST